ncbi:MAG: hypothetical protein JWQ76_5386 [Ramlibacter sp.]|nr:hypothetical protein [Ramlibacter sp.]
MNPLYQVFAHPDHGQWGYATEAIDGEVQTAFIDARDGGVTLRCLAPRWVAPAIQHCLRSGFRRMAQQKYLELRPCGPRTVGAFVSTHPDLGGDLAGALLYFAVVPARVDMQDVAGQWQQALATTTPIDGRAAWLAHCARASAYAPATSGDAAAALLLAQWARDHDWILLPASVAALPGGKPRERASAWRACLGRCFDAGALENAFAELGWPSRASVGQPMPFNINPDPADPAAWLSIAQQVCF